MVYERVKYKLIDNDRGKEIWLQNDPKGWDESEYTLKRSEKTYGVFSELSKGLEFFEEGADFLRYAKYNRDIEADVILQEWRIHPEEDSIYKHSQGTFDFSEFQETILGVKVPFKSGGLNSTLKSKLNEKFELGRLLSIKNKDIDALSLKDVGFEGRKIFLITSWDTDNINKEIGASGDENTNLAVDSNTGDTFGDITALPLRIVGQSHEGWAESIVPFRLKTDGPAPGGVNYKTEASNVFFFNNDQRRQLNLEFAYDYVAWFSQYEDVGWCSYILSLVRFENGADLDFKERIDVIHQLRSSNISAHTGAIVSEAVLPGNFNATTKITRRLTGEYSKTVTLEPGESLSFELWLRVDMEDTNTAGVRVNAQDVVCTLELTEDSYFDPTTSKTALMHDVGEKLMQIITGDKLKFKSEFYGRKELGYDQDGEFAFTGLTQGFWVRDFLDKELEISLKDFLETSNVIHNTGYSIEERDGEEFLVLEDLEYFFQDAVTIELPEQVSNLTRRTAKELYYSNLDFGYKKPEGDNLYEEALGLDEYNTRTSYTTPITRVDYKYEKISPARADSYGMEFARRKNKELFPKEDTRYDKTVFILDLKTITGTSSLAERKWADDFDQEPKNVYSPKTATNLRLTPYRISERHQWFYGSGLKRFQQDYITHSSSVGNSDLETKMVGETARKERDSFIISSLERTKFLNEWIEFEYEVDYFVNKQLYGFTEINGKSVPNYFGKVKFINEKGLVEYGYLFELKPNKEGKWKLLKAI